MATALGNYPPQPAARAPQTLAFATLASGWGSDVPKAMASDSPTRMVFTMGNGDVWRFDESGSSWTLLGTLVGGLSANAIAVLPNGKYIIANNLGVSPSHIYLFDPANGTNGIVSNSYTSDFAWVLVPAVDNSGMWCVSGFHGGVFFTADGTSISFVGQPVSSMAILGACQTANGDLYIGGEGDGNLPNLPTPVRSADGGVTWSTLGLDNNNSVHNSTGLTPCNTANQVCLGRQSSDGSVCIRVRKPDNTVVDATGTPSGHSDAQRGVAVGSNRMLIPFSAGAGFISGLYLSTDDGFSWALAGHGLPTNIAPGMVGKTANYVYYFDGQSPGTLYRSPY